MLILTDEEIASLAEKPLDELTDDELAVVAEQALKHESERRAAQYVEEQRHAFQHLREVLIDLRNEIEAAQPPTGAMASR